MHNFLGGKKVFFKPYIYFLLICLSVTCRKEILLLISRLNMPCHVFLCAESRERSFQELFFPPDSIS